MRSNKIVTERVRVGAIAAFFVVASGFGAADAQQRPMPGTMHKDGGMMMGQGMGPGMMMNPDQMAAMMNMMQSMMPGMMMCRMGEHVEGRLAYLKAELKITDAQMPQWNAFADAFRASGQKVMKHCAMMKEHGDSTMSATLPEQLNMMEQHMTTHLESLRAIKTAAQQLYSVLSDEQKKIADQMMMGHMEMRD